MTQKQLAASHGLTWRAVAYRMKVKGMSLDQALTTPKYEKKPGLRSMAIDAGETKFYGNDCGKSHGGLRYASNGACVDCHYESRLRSLKKKRSGA